MLGATRGCGSGHSPERRRRNSFAGNQAGRTFWLTEDEGDLPLQRGTPSNPTKTVSFDAFIKDVPTKLSESPLLLSATSPPFRRRRAMARGGAGVRLHAIRGDATLAAIATLSATGGSSSSVAASRNTRPDRPAWRDSSFDSDVPVNLNLLESGRFDSPYPASSWTNPQAGALLDHIAETSTRLVENIQQQQEIWSVRRRKKQQLSAELRSTRVGPRSRSAPDLASPARPRSGSALPACMELGFAACPGMSVRSQGGPSECKGEPPMISQMSDTTASSLRSYRRPSSVLTAFDLGLHERLVQRSTSSLSSQTVGEMDESSLVVHACAEDTEDDGDAQDSEPSPVSALSTERAASTERAPSHASAERTPSHASTERAPSCASAERAPSHASTGSSASSMELPPGASGDLSQLATKPWKQAQRLQTAVGVLQMLARPRRPFE